MTPPYQFNNIEISITNINISIINLINFLTAANIDRYRKILMKWQLMKKDRDPKYLFLANIF